MSEACLLPLRHWAYCKRFSSDIHRALPRLLDGSIHHDQRSRVLAGVACLTEVCSTRLTRAVSACRRRRKCGGGVKIPQNNSLVVMHAIASATFLFHCLLISQVSRKKSEAPAAAAAAPHVRDNASVRTGMDVQNARRVAGQHTGCFPARRAAAGHRA